MRKLFGWLDRNINHTIIDAIFDRLPTENKDGSDSVYYRFWKATFRRFCCWVAEHEDDVDDREKK